MYNDVILSVRISPHMEDVGQLNTLIHFSLQELFGTTHSHQVEVINMKKKDKNSTATLKTSSRSVNHVRAALTIPTPPPFMKMRFSLDVTNVEKEKIIDSTKKL